MITKVNIKLHRYVGLYMSELYLLWNIYVNIEYKMTYKHVLTCLNMSVWLEVQKDPFHRFRFLLTWSRKKNLVDAFYTQGGVLNFNQQCTMGPNSLWSCIKNNNFTRYFPKLKFLTTSLWLHTGSKKLSLSSSVQ